MFKEFMLILRNHMGKLACTYRNQNSNTSHCIIFMNSSYVQWICWNLLIICEFISSFGFFIHTIIILSAHNEVLFLPFQFFYLMFVCLFFFFTVLAKASRTVLNTLQLQKVMTNIPLLFLILKKKLCFQ